MKVFKKALQYIVLIFFALIFVAPLYVVVLNSFKTRSEVQTNVLALPHSFYLGNYIEIISKSDFLSSFITSVIVVVVTTTLTTLLAAITGYALARWKSKASTAITLGIMTTLFVPFQVYMVALIVVAKSLHMIGNLPGLVIIYIALGVPVPIFLCRSYCVNFPTDMEEAAVVDGCSNMKMLFKIVLPLMKPILATVAVLNALWVWGEFLVAFVVYGNGKFLTLPLSQRYFFGTYSNQWNLILTNFVLSSIPIIILYIAMQKNIVKGIVAGAVKG